MRMTLLVVAGLLGACRAADVAATTTPAEAAPAAAQLGQLAPDFTLTDLDGKEHALSALRGKTVVLEWFNPGCPYVKHAHGEGGVLSTYPAEATGQGVVWLAINSGAPGKQGHGVEANKQAVGGWKMGYPVLLDESGDVGRLYGAMTTPHIYVVDPAGKLVYRGAIDNRPLGEGQGTAVNYVAKALADLGAGRGVATADTKPYGCSVKY
jgi:thiol-disulfide isomerase/thioredoxin